MSEKGRYGKGYVEDSHDTSKDQTIRHLLGAQFGVPAEFTLEPYMLTPIKDQSITSTCVGFSLARAIDIRCAFMGARIPWPSPYNIYTVARAKARPDPSVPLVDNGSMPTLAAEGMNEWGVASEEDWPSDPAHVNDEPDLFELERAALFENVQSFRVDSEGAARVEDIKHAISSGFPVAIGTEVDRAFEDYAGGTNHDGSPAAVTAPIPTDLLGGHMLALIGYRLIKGILYFVGVNSWGTTWGNKGLFLADVAWVANQYVGDIIAVTVSPTALGVTKGVLL